MILGQIRGDLIPAAYHVATARLANLVLLAPNPEWVKAVMPNAKLPDRVDFKAYGDRIADRQRDWRQLEFPAVLPQKYMLPNLIFVVNSR